MLPELSRLAPQSEKCAKNPSAFRNMRRKRVEREAIHGPLRLATLVKHPGDHVPVREQDQSTIYRAVTRQTRRPLGGRGGDEIKSKKWADCGIRYNRLTKFLENMTV